MAVAERASFGVRPAVFFVLANPVIGRINPLLVELIRM
jgi:hypothetical protein